MPDPNPPRVWKLVGMGEGTKPNGVWMGSALPLNESVLAVEAAPVVECLERLFKARKATDCAEAWKQAAALRSQLKEASDA